MGTYSNLTAFDDIVGDKCVIEVELINLIFYTLPKILFILQA